MHRSNREPYQRGRSPIEGNLHSNLPLSTSNNRQNKKVSHLHHLRNRMTGTPNRDFDLSVHKTTNCRTSKYSIFQDYFSSFLQQLMLSPLGAYYYSSWLFRQIQNGITNQCFSVNNTIRSSKGEKNNSSTAESNSRNP